MPIFKYPKISAPLWIEADYKANKRGLRHTVYSVNGDKYTGHWLDNKKHGKGTYIWKETGCLYDGDWYKGRRNGFGTLSYQDGKGGYVKEYSGGWKNDLRHGYGTEYYNRCETYEGEWYAGKRSGWGRMYYKDGTVYEGEWFDDQRSGRGMVRQGPGITTECTKTTGTKQLTNQIVRGGGESIKLSGSQELIIQGDRSVAESVKPSGSELVMKQINENRYEGGWKNCKKHGPGKYYYLDTGQVFEGVWVDGVPKCGVMKDFSRDIAPEPTKYPIPKVELLNPDEVVAEAEALYLQDPE